MVVASTKKGTRGSRRGGTRDWARVFTARRGARGEEGRGSGLFTAHSTRSTFFHPNSISNEHCNVDPPRWLAQASSTQLERQDVK